MSYRQRAALGAAVLLLAEAQFPAQARRHHTLIAVDTVDPSPETPRLSTERTGTLPTKDGLRLKVSADMGNVHILTDATGQISYRVTLEADGRDEGAGKLLHDFSLSAKQTPAGPLLNGLVSWKSFRSRVWVNYEIHVPRRYNVDVNTAAGNIEVQDIDGRVALVTAGGNISVGEVRPANAHGRSVTDGSEQTAARLETSGGHITIGDVAGDLRAATLGGHITTGNIDGDALLRTGGGHIHTAHISGVATLETGGGNIHVDTAGSSVTATTAGGQIDFGQTVGAIRAHTGGGAVHIERVSGPTEVDSNGGSVFLKQVNGPLRVSAATGNITAWFDGAKPGAANADNSARKMGGASQLLCNQGDIIVYLSPDLGVTIDAVVEQGGAHRILADPSLPLQVSYLDSSSGAREVRGQGSLNGGGDVLHLKAVSGNILLKLGEPSSESGANAPAAGNWGNFGEDDENYNDARSFIEEVRRRFESSWWGGVPVEPDEVQKRLAYSVIPIYPDVARKAGIEGDVVLRAYISSDGHITSLRVLSGAPVLARAATEAVEKWRYQPVTINGHATNIVTTLTVAFRLH